MTWQSRKFPPTKIKASTVTCASANGSYKSEGSGLKHHGSTANCTSVLENSNCYCHPADGVFNSNSLVALCYLLQKWQRNQARSYRARLKSCVDCVIHLLFVHAQRGALASGVTKFKTIKILRAFSGFPRKLAALKITHHVVNSMSPTQTTNQSKIDVCK